MDKKILEINTCNFGSSGNIMLNIMNRAKRDGYNVVIAYAKSRSNMKKYLKIDMYIGSIFERNLHLLLGKMTGYNGCFSCFSTYIFLRKLRKYNPNIIHLHNLHNSYINLSMLFSYIKKNNIAVIWTLHDCWSFTGQCPHFTMVECDKWKTGCHHCPQYHAYPQSYVDRSKTMYKLKKKWFTGVQNMTIVTPSQWLAELVKQSYLKDYPVTVINNGIDLNMFKPTPSNFRENHGLTDKYVVLGVAFGWDKRKGLDVFIELSKRLEDSFKIVLVGTNEATDALLPPNIISIHRTSNQIELAKLYTAADVFVNPTREENFPTVNIEAIACGTPVITFDTGGSPEMLDNTCGSVVPCDDIDMLESRIIDTCKNKPYSTESCIQRAKQYSKEIKFEEYIQLFESITNNSK